MSNTLPEIKKVSKDEIVKKHISAYYHHKGRSINLDDILPMSRILPMMDEYAQAYHASLSQESVNILEGETDWVKRYELLRRELNMPAAIIKLSQEIAASRPRTEGNEDELQDEGLWQYVELTIRESIGLDPYRSNKIVDYLKSKYTIHKKKIYEMGCNVCLFWFWPQGIF